MRVYDVSDLHCSVYNDIANEHLINLREMKKDPERQVCGTIGKKETKNAI